MKKYITIFFLLVNLILFGQAMAQPGGGRMGNRPGKEKVEAMKIGFITDYLDLSSEEAKEFWPVYNKYQDEIEVLRKGRRQNIMNDRADYETMSDAELEKIVDSEIIFHQNELDIQKKYHPQFKKVLPMRKVARLYRAEEEFKKKLLDMIRERKQERRNNE
ncbi:MAG: hypothetical protein ACO1G6_05685 [Bacteroidota bacterium]